MSLSINNFSIVDQVLPNESVEDREREKRAILKSLLTPPISDQRISRISVLEENGQTFPLCRKLEVGPDGSVYLLLNKKTLGDTKGTGQIKTVAQAVRFQDRGQTISSAARIGICLTKATQHEENDARRAARVEIAIRQQLGLYLGTTEIYPSQKQTRIENEEEVEKIAIYSKNWYEGGELFDAIVNRLLSNAQKEDCAKQLVEKLIGIHEKGVAHLDIKPENVLAKQKITPSSNPEWEYEDFDKSETIPGREHIRQPNVEGTLMYSAPELRKNKHFLLRWCNKG